jgi:hypothetical protein
MNPVKSDILFRNAGLDMEHFNPRFKANPVRRFPDKLLYDTTYCPIVNMLDGDLYCIQTYEQTQPKPAKLLRVKKLSKWRRLINLLFN